jgi:hypothetical protein
MTTSPLGEITAALHQHADEGISGADALAWLRGQGVTDGEARKLVAAVVIARRPISVEAPATALDVEASAATEADGLTVGPEMRNALVATGWLPPNDTALIRRIAEIAHKNCEQVDPGAILDVIGYAPEVSA